MFLVLLALRERRAEFRHQGEMRSRDTHSPRSGAPVQYSLVECSGADDPQGEEADSVLPKPPEAARSDSLATLYRSLVSPRPYDYYENVPFVKYPTGKTLFRLRI